MVMKGNRLGGNFSAEVTISDREGKIIYMNEESSRKSCKIRRKGEPSWQVFKRMPHGKLLAENSGTAQNRGNKSLYSRKKRQKKTLLSESLV